MATAGTTIQAAYVAGELAPAMFGRVDNEKYKLGSSTMRNGFVNFQGGWASRAGLAYIGMCKQAAPNPGTATIDNVAGGTSINTGPPRDIQFQFSVSQGFVLEFGDYYMRVKFRGAYVTEAAKTVTAITQAAPGVITSAAHGFSNGDWLFAPATFVGMTFFNGLIFVVQNATTDTFTLTDLFGNPINTNTFPAFVSGSFARVYTVTTIYQAVDLPYLKVTQSADEMSLTCWNQQTLTEYPPYDLVRHSNTNWVFTATTFGSTITAPTNIAGTPQNSTTEDTWYAYVVTAVSSDGDESIASAVVYIHNNNISVNAGSNTVTWSPVAGAVSYNVYQATPYYSTAASPTIQVGVNYGFVGSALGTSFVDSNIQTDFTQTPPLHRDPFARGQLTGVTITSAGSGQTQENIAFSITTAAGTGFAGTPIILNGGLNGFYIANTGEGYLPGDTITFTDSDMGAVVGTADLVIGPETGTYPGVAAYFQQRRGYGSTENNPDTYYFSHPGTFTTMDSSLPVTASDAIIGTPWAQQVNGIQFMTPMPGGLIMFNGNGAWLLTGGNNAALTPADQDAQPQSRYGCSSTVEPIPINFNILFVRENDGIVYNLQFNFWVNIYQGTDMTVFSSHLFEGFTIKRWAYSEKPYKLVWAVRSDGTMLSLTYIAEQNEQGWARHDTNGIFICSCAIEEPPVDAVYVIVQRFIQNNWVYYAERFDNRIWDKAEDCFCVDAGLSYPMTSPAATLFPAAPAGTNNITSASIAFGGAGYTNPHVSAIDDSGKGHGATFTAAVSGGVISGITPLTTGQDYTPGETRFLITDPTGHGFEGIPVITNYVVFNASGSVFSAGMVNDVIRGGNGKSIIVQYNSPTQVLANIIQPITSVLQDNTYDTPVVIPQVAGTWTISAPTKIVRNLNHLEGKTVTGLADGGVITPVVVQNGQITLPVAASQIVVGLPFIAQLQALPLDLPTPNTVQTKRKNIPSVGLRVHNSRGATVGSNKPDASAQPGGVNVPWTGMVPVKEMSAAVPAGQPIPLMTDDYFINIGPDWNTKGKIAFEQKNPLPLNIDAHVSYYNLGDTASPA